MSAQKKKNVTHLAVLFTICGVFLLLIAVGGLVFRCRALELRLEDMFIESMTSHTLESGEKARLLIDDTQVMLEDAVEILTKDGRSLDKG